MPGGEAQLRVTAKIKGPSIAKQQKRFETAVRDGFKSAMDLWQRQFGPRHFELGAYSRYNYAKRTRKYTRRKKKVMGHVVPLVWSGASRRTIRTRFVDATVRKDRKTHQFKVRKNLGVRLYGRQAELLETIPEEVDAMVNEVYRVVQQEIKSIAAEDIEVVNVK